MSEKMNFFGNSNQDNSHDSDVLDINNKAVSEEELEYIEEQKHFSNLKEKEKQDVLNKFPLIPMREVNFPITGMLALFDWGKLGIVVKETEQTIFVGFIEEDTIRESIVTYHTLDKKYVQGVLQYVDSVVLEELSKFPEYLFIEDMHASPIDSYHSSYSNYTWSGEDLKKRAVDGLFVSMSHVQFSESTTSPGGFLYETERYFRKDKIVKILRNFYTNKDETLLGRWRDKHIPSDVFGYTLILTSEEDLNKKKDEIRDTQTDVSYLEVQTLEGFATVLLDTILYIRQINNVTSSGIRDPKQPIINSAIYLNGGVVVEVVDDYSVLSRTWIDSLARRRNRDINSHITEKFDYIFKEKEKTLQEKSNQRR